MPKALKTKEEIEKAAEEAAEQRRFWRRGVSGLKKIEATTKKTTRSMRGSCKKEEKGNFSEANATQDFPQAKLSGRQEQSTASRTNKAQPKRSCSKEAILSSFKHSRSK
jgi:hypothetical protein